MPASLAVRLSRTFSSSPLRHATFRQFYIGSIGTALGYTMQATVAAWLMATLTPSALMVALVQTASTGPALLFGMVAGTLADIVDRRHVVLITQIALLSATALLGFTTIAGWTGPSGLLALTFVVGAGFTFYQPAQQASINDLVERKELAPAVALGAVAFNVSRAIGPALAGALTAWLGTGSTLVASSAFFVLMIVALRRMKSRERALPGVPERLWAGVASGLRYARHSPAMRSLIIRNVNFAICASVFWALLPVIARDELNLGAGGFGLLSAGFGTGAIFGALALPRMLGHKPLNAVVTSGVLLWTLSIVLIGVTVYTVLVLLAAFACGAAWVTVFSSLSAGTQSAAPAWVRARMVATNLVANQASLAIGSAIWGAAASAFGLRKTLIASAVVIALLHAIYRSVRVEMASEADVTPGARLPDFTILDEPSPDDGPVLIQVEYRIDPANRDAFLKAIHAIEPTRRRNGATSWRVFRDLAEEGRYVERYIIDSWAEYVRLRSRMTVSDRRLQERVAEYQRPGHEIRVSRLLGVASDLP